MIGLSNAITALECISDQHEMLSLKNSCNMQQEGGERAGFFNQEVFVSTVSS